jgi:hypothetical protein
VYQRHQHILQQAELPLYHSQMLQILRSSTLNSQGEVGSPWRIYLPYTRTASCIATVQSNLFDIIAVVITQDQVNKCFLLDVMLIAWLKNLIGKDAVFLYSTHRFLYIKVNLQAEKKSAQLQTNYRKCDLFLFSIFFPTLKHVWTYKKIMYTLKYGKCL